MTTYHFCNPELSQKLIDFGVVGQFDYYWFKDGSLIVLDNPGMISHYVKITKAIHWSDICLAENAKKIWTNKTYKQILEKPKQLLSMVVLPNIYKVDWQSWLTEQLSNVV